jgi:hypothetical protein
MKRLTSFLGRSLRTRVWSVAAGAFVAVSSMAASSIAAVVTFNSSPDNSYFVNPINSEGFTFTDLTGEESLGTDNNLDDSSVDNGTIHLMDWSNSVPLSTMRMEATGGWLFGLSSFDFTSGYLDGSSIADQLSVTGYDTGDNVVAFAIFTNSDYSNLSFTNLNLSSSFHGLKYVIFEASGTYNRVGYDNFAIVPEPTSLAVFGIGMCIAGVNAARLRRSKKQQDAMV